MAVSSTRLIRAMVCILTLVPSMTIWPPNASAQTTAKVALVIGNAAYTSKSAPALITPTNDASLIANRLKSLGFTLVGGDGLTNLSRSQFVQAIKQFVAAMNGADVAVFYYAGHGVEADDVNWLVPIEADPHSATDLSLELVSAQDVLDEMNQVNVRLKVLILDACRDNPFSGRGFRSLSQGLSAMNAPAGALILYATSPGDQAADGTVDSPFTTALASEITKPGEDIVQAFNDVSLAVKNTTNDQQIPWYAASAIQGDFYFVSSRGIATPAETSSALFARGVAYFNGGNVDGARSAFTSVVSLNPEDAEAHAYLARIAVWGDVDTPKEIAHAMAEAQTALAIDPNLADAHFALGKVANLEHRDADAKSELLTAIKLDPNLSAPHITLGYLLGKVGDVTGEEREERTALALDPNLSIPPSMNGAIAHNNLGAALLDQGEKTQAESEFREAASLNQRYELPSYNLARLLFSEQRFSEAESGLEKLIADNPQDANALQLLGDSYREQGKTDAAAAAYGSAIAADPKAVNARIGLGILQLTQGNPDKALVFFKDAVAVGPNDAGAHNAAGVAYEQLKRFDLAETELQRAAKLDPKWALPHQNLADVYRAVGRTADAEAEDAKAAQLRKAAGANP